MTPTKIPHLCGGTFFDLLLEARKPRIKVRNTGKGGTDGLNGTDLFRGLIEVVTGDKTKSVGRSFDKTASNYKTCASSKGDYVPFTVSATQNAFDAQYKKQDPGLFSRMSEFINTYLNKEKCEWLVYAIIDTMQQDDTVQQEDLDIRIAINYTESLKVCDLHNAKTIVFLPFLLSVLHYVVMKCPDCESGRPTFEAWYSQPKPKAKWVFKSDIGKKIGPIAISFDLTTPVQTSPQPSSSKNANKIILNAIETSQSKKISTLLGAANGFLTSYANGSLAHESPEMQIYTQAQFYFLYYFNSAKRFYSEKKTLLYAEKPRPFYKIYVCNDLKQTRLRIRFAGEPEKPDIIHDATIQKIENESKYIVIEGTGGIGKSMLLTHLFLSAANDTPENETPLNNLDKFPVFISLKDYKATMSGIIDFILSVVRSFTPTIEKEHVLKLLEKKQLVLLLDGYDEITSSARESFDKSLESFVKSYPDNSIIISSRPVSTFVSYTHFSLLDIQPLTKDQSLSLIDKLEFWDSAAKQSFRDALNRNLYYTHKQFASNPLLLTIMLMTYSTFGEVPEKMHVFYTKAFETMARLHDATKGAYKRPLHTNISPEEFAKYFSQFCARTYVKEVLEFTNITFASYMDAVLKGSPIENTVSSRDFLLDITDNLCIMYREGDKYYFIHRSFQEYFAAVYFSSEFDSRLIKIGYFFENMKKRSFSDKTFDMLYDMIPEKVERFIFLPFLEDCFKNWGMSIPIDDHWNSSEKVYWNFLTAQYPVIHYEYGDSGAQSSNLPKSYLYGFIVRAKKIAFKPSLDDLNWPDSVFEMPYHEWVNAYVAFTDLSGFSRWPNPNSIPESVLLDVMPYLKDDLPPQYSDFFGDPEYDGLSIEINTQDLKMDPDNYADLREFITDKKFPIRKEFERVKKYYIDLQAHVIKETNSNDLFGDKE